MTYPDFNARAELYLGSDRHTAIAQGARTFATAAQAVRFAFEEAAPVSLHGAMLKVGDATYTGDDLAALYRSAAFPLPRRQDIKRARARRAANRHNWTPTQPRTAPAPRHAAVA
jgi:hypothetical protein